MTIDPVIAWALRGALAIVFLGAAWHKLSEPRRFSATLRSYEVLPRSWSPIVARLLPAVELAVAISLLWPAAQRVAAVAAISVLFVYTGAIALNLARGRREIDCGCFAASARVPLSRRLLVRNAGLIAAACVTFIPGQPRPLHWLDALTLGASLVAFLLLSATAGRLAQTGPSLRRIGATR